MKFQSSLRSTLGVAVLLMICLAHESLCESHLPPTKLTISQPNGDKPLPVGDYHSSHQTGGVTTPVANHPSSHKKEGVVAPSVANRTSSHQRVFVTTPPVADDTSSRQTGGEAVTAAAPRASSHNPEDVTSFPVTDQHSAHQASIKPLPRHQSEGVNLSQVINQVPVQNPRAEFQVPADSRALHKAENIAFSTETKRGDATITDNVPDVMSEFNELHKVSIVTAERIRNLVQNFSKILKAHRVSGDNGYDHHAAISTQRGRQDDLEGSKDVPKECEEASKHLNDIIVTAKIAKSKFDEFKNDFAKDKFNGSDWNTISFVLGNMGIDVQPIIPAVEENAVLGEEMVKVYHQLQQHVVGLENATLDQIDFSVPKLLANNTIVDNDHRGPYLEPEFYLGHFTELIGYLEQLLIFTMQGMDKLGVVPEGDRTLEVVQQEYTFLDEALKDFRDFFVLHKYEEGLQHIITVFTSICPNINM